MDFCIKLCVADTSVLATSGLLYQKQEWNGQMVLRTIVYGSKALSDTYLNNRAPRAK